MPIVIENIRNQFSENNLIICTLYSALHQDTSGKKRLAINKISLKLVKWLLNDKSSSCIKVQTFLEICFGVEDLFYRRWSGSEFVRMWPAMCSSWTENVIMSNFLGFLWDLSDVFTVHTFSARAQIQFLKSILEGWF